MILIYAAIAIVGLAVLGLALRRIQVNKKAKKTIEVAPLPPTPTNVSGPQEVCPNSSEYYSATAPGPDYYILWEWNNDNGTATATGNRVMITFGSTASNINVYQVDMANPSLPIRPLALQLSRQGLRRRRIPAQPAARPPRCPCPVRVDFLSRTCPNREGRPPAAQCHCFSQLLRPRCLNRLHDSGTQSLQHTMYQQRHRSPWADRPARRQPRSILRQHPCPTQRNV